MWLSTHKHTGSATYMYWYRRLSTHKDTCSATHMYWYRWLSTHKDMCSATYMYSTATGPTLHRYRQYTQHPERNYKISRSSDSIMTMCMFACYFHTHYSHVSCHFAQSIGNACTQCVILVLWLTGLYLCNVAAGFSRCSHTSCAHKKWFLLKMFKGIVETYWECDVQSCAFVVVLFHFVYRIPEGYGHLYDDVLVIGNTVVRNVLLTLSFSGSVWRVV
jgi:hypothetical protein